VAVLSSENLDFQRHAVSERFACRRTFSPVTRDNPGWLAPESELFARGREALSSHQWLSGSDDWAFEYSRIRTKKARFRGLFDLVAGAGFEPAAFRL
jgi:hypothetical protein